MGKHYHLACPVCWMITVLKEVEDSFQLSGMEQMYQTIPLFGKQDNKKRTINKNFFVEYKTSGTLLIFLRLRHTIERKRKFFCLA